MDVRCRDRGNDGADELCCDTVLPFIGAGVVSGLRSVRGFPFVRHSAVVCVMDE